MSHLTLANESNISRRAFIALAACAMAMPLGGMFGCSQSPAESDEQAQADSAGKDTKKLIDMLGNEVTVPNPITHLFNAYPVNVGVMSMLGTTSVMSYVLPRIHDPRWAWLREINPHLKDLPTIGEDGGASAEEILSIEPEVVVVNNKSKAEEYRNAGLTVYAITAKSNEDFLEAVEKTADLFDEKAVAVAAEYRSLFEENLGLAKSRTADVPEGDRPRAYYISGKTPYVTETGSRGIEILPEVGGVFPFEVELVDGKPAEATAEQIIASDPTLIIIGNNTKLAAREALLQDKSLSSLTAVADGRIFLTPQGIGSWDMYGPEYALFPLWLGKTLYPDRFADIDLEEKLRTFYRTFFNYDLTSENAQLMLAGQTSPKKA